MLEVEPVDSQPFGYLLAAGAVVKPTRGGGHHEEAIGPGRPRHGGPPAVADGELPRQRVEHRKLRRAVAPHDLAGAAPAAGAGVARDVPGGVDRRILPA